jgi:SecD/SecF fusion protein
LQSTAQLEFWETYKIEEIGNFNGYKWSIEKTEINKVEAKPAVVKDSLSALLTDAKDTADAKRKQSFIR